MPPQFWRRAWPDLGMGRVSSGPRRTDRTIHIWISIGSILSALLNAILLLVATGAIADAVQKLLAAAWRARLPSRAPGFVGPSPRDKDRERDVYGFKAKTVIVGFPPPISGAIWL
jgi:hypothetical protein